jgi:uncharacterized protein with gpF-like domain
LLQSGIIKKNGDYILISFLDEQLAELNEKSRKLSEAGKKGVLERERKKQATLKPPLSNKDKDKDKDKDNINPLFLSCSELLKKRVLEKRQQKITDKTLKDWSNIVRLMTERDDRTLDDIKSLINECHDMQPSPSGFTWADNILSMGKLREKWNEGKIFVGMNKNKGIIF